VIEIEMKKRLWKHKGIDTEKEFGRESEKEKKKGERKA